MQLLVLACVHKTCEIMKAPPPSVHEPATQMPPKYFSHFCYHTKCNISATNANNSNNNTSIYYIFIINTIITSTSIFTAAWVADWHFTRCVRCVYTSLNRNKSVIQRPSSAIRHPLSTIHHSPSANCRLCWQPEEWTAILLRLGSQFIKSFIFISATIHLALKSEIK